MPGLWIGTWELAPRELFIGCKPRLIPHWIGPIECCAPIIVAEGDGICDLVELSNRTKIPARRMVEASGEAIVDVGNAWGPDNALKMVARHLRPDYETKRIGSLSDACAVSTERDR